MLTSRSCVVLSPLGCSLFAIVFWSTKFVIGNVCAAENVGSGKNCSLSEVSSGDPVRIEMEIYDKLYLRIM